MRLTINMSAERVPEQFHCKEGSWQVWRVRADLHVALCEKHGKAQLADAPKRTADETYGQILAETARSPGRDTSAGHMKLAYVLVFVGMISELRIVADVRS